MTTVDLTDMELTTTHPPLIELNDVPAQLTTIRTVIDGVPMMDEQEARACVTRIKTRLDITRGELLELHDREGWKALGYNSWGACVRAEFEGSSTALYRQLAAAKIEREVFGDSRIGNPVPASQLEVVKDLPTEQKRAAFKRADELAGDQPRTARHIEAAAKEISAPDLPLEFAVIQRRYDKHGHMLVSTWDGVTRRYVVRKHGDTGTGVVRSWPDVLSKLERLETPEPHDPAHVEAIEEQIEADRIPEAGMVIGYEAKEVRDADRLSTARANIAIGNVADARQLLEQIEVSTYARDQLLRQIPRMAAQQFLADQRDRLTRFSQSAMVSQATFKAALDHMQALLEATE